MQTETHIETKALTQETNTVPRWHIIKRIAFRFMFAYLVLYNLPFPLTALPLTDYLAGKYSDLWDMIVVRVGRYVLHPSSDIATRSSMIVRW